MKKINIAGIIKIQRATPRHEKVVFEFLKQSFPLSVQAHSPIYMNNSLKIRSITTKTTAMN